MIDVFENLKRQREKDDAERAAAIAFFGPPRDLAKMRRNPSGAQRPLCACCGKPYGERSYHYSSQRYAIGTPIPPYQGNHIVIEEHISPGPGMGPGNVAGASVSRTTWDGESYRAKSGTDPFCTQRCALDFARGAHVAGYRIIKEETKCPA